MHVNQSWLWIHRSPTGWITFLGSRRAVSRFIIWDLDAMLNYVTKSQTKMTRDRRIQQIITSSIFGFIFWEINVNKRWENRRRKVIIVSFSSFSLCSSFLHPTFPSLGFWITLEPGGYSLRNQAKGMLMAVVLGIPSTGNISSPNRHSDTTSRI